MRCAQCGNILPEDALFCDQCGTPTGLKVQQPPVGEVAGGEVVGPARNGQLGRQEATPAAGGAEPQGAGASQTPSEAGSMPAEIGEAGAIAADRTAESVDDLATGALAEHAHADDGMPAEALPADLPGESAEAPYEYPDQDFDAEAPRAFRMWGMLVSNGETLSPDSYENLLSEDGEDSWNSFEGIPWSDDEPNEDAAKNASEESEGAEAPETYPEPQAKGDARTDGLDIATISQEEGEEPTVAPASHPEEPRLGIGIVISIGVIGVAAAVFIGIFVVSFVLSLFSG